MAEVERGYMPRLENLPIEIEIKSLYMGFNYIIKGIRGQKKAISEMSRMALILALGKALRPEVLEHLKSFIKPGEQVDYRIRVNALVALGRFEYNEIKNLFFKMFSHADVNIAVAASEYFLAKGAAADAKPLLKKIKNEYPVG